MAMPKTVNYPPYLFNQIADFGTVKSETNRHTGMQVPTFVKKLTLHVYQQKTTLNRLYEAIGTEYENTLTLVINHNPQVTDLLRVKYRGKVYRIVNLSPDESANYVTYDFLTLSLDKKAGDPHA